MFNCTCVECGNDFNAKTMIAAICSSRCKQRRYRKTDKGKLSVLRTNAKAKRPDIKKVCIHCKVVFITSRKAQELCSVCSPKVSTYYSQKKYWAKRGFIEHKIVLGKLKCDLNIFIDEKLDMLFQESQHSGDLQGVSFYSYKDSDSDDLVLRLRSRVELDKDELSRFIATCKRTMAPLFVMDTVK